MASLRPLVLAPFLFVLMGCPGRAPGVNDGGEGGPLQPPSLTSVAPASGPQSGGTAVTLSGANFENGIKVFFGAGEASQVVVLSKRKVSARTPAVAVTGPMTVKVVNPDGQAAELPDGFNYEPDVNHGVTAAFTLNPVEASSTTGINPVTTTVVGEVEVPGVTAGAGQGPGVKAQVGVATELSNPVKPTDFQWTDATYLADSDGPNQGDLLRDRYSAQVTLPGATGAEVKTYVLATRFSLDDGANWTIADHDGLANGLNVEQLSRFVVSRPVVGWCKLGGQIVEAPPVVFRKTGQAGVTVYSQVYLLDATDHPGAGAGLVGQLGYGAPGADPASWTWVNAQYNVDTGSGANDEYRAVLPTPANGTYAFAFRYAVNGGPLKYCDADGSDGPGYTADQAGKLVVSAVGVDRCSLVEPSSLTARTGVSTGRVKGRVYGLTLTDAPGAAAGITAELGYGPAGMAPGAGWTWTAASYTADAEAGASDEYQASLVGPAAGTYEYAFRFSYAGGTPVVCDLDGSDNGYQSAKAGSMAAAPVGIDLCSIEGPANRGAIPGQSSPSIFGRVHSLSVTDHNGAGAGITAQIGYGPVGSQPGPSWTWVAASYASDQDMGTSDQYSQRLPALAAGSYDVAYRFHYASGADSYCDLDGSGNGYQPAQAVKLTVAPAAVQSCKLQYVDVGSVPSGGTVTAYGRVLVPGLTDDVGQGAGVLAQVGVGTQGDDASTSANWGWKSAAFFSDIGASGEDEYKVTFQPAYSGTRAVSFRFSVNGGSSWSYCDLNGSDVGGYEVGQQHALAVGAHGDLGFCNLQSPYAAGNSTVIYGQVWDPALSSASGVSAWLGYGKKTEDPGLAWSWVPATFNTVVGGNFEFQAPFSSASPGTFAYAFRFQRSGSSSYCYGDRDGAGAGANNGGTGFNGESQFGDNLGAATVP